jgi:hypothetical protein
MELLQSAISTRHITHNNHAVVVKKAGSSYPNEEGHTNKWRQAKISLQQITALAVYCYDSSDLFAAFLPFHNGQQK